jgi:hypothetical protein
MYVSIFYVLTHSFVKKMTFFVSYAKKAKTHVVKKLILVPKFVIFI